MGAAGGKCCCADENGQNQNQIALKAPVSATDQPIATQVQDESKAIVEPMETNSLEGNPAMFEVLIVKEGSEDKLGMDVKHTQGKLEVVHIFPQGAVQRANKNSQGGILEVGDMIHSINGFDNDHQMVAECRLRQKLQIRAYRK